MRPMASTWVASMQNIAAPESERLLMWVKCQSLAEPSSAEYWHIGDTMMRLASFRPRNSIGENRALMRGNPGVGGRREPNLRSRRRDYQRQRRRWRPCAISGASRIPPVIGIAVLARLQIDDADTVAGEPLALGIGKELDVEFAA